MVISSWRSGGWMDVDSLSFVCLFVVGAQDTRLCIVIYISDIHIFSYIYCFDH